MGKKKGKDVTEEIDDILGGTSEDHDDNSEDRKRIKELEAQLAAMREAQSAASATDTSSAEQANADEKPLKFAEAPKDDDDDVIHIHILKDGFIAAGTVWYRGQEIRVSKDSIEYKQQIDRNGNTWLDLADNPQAQYQRYGEQVFAPGPWPGRPWTDADPKAAKAEKARRGLFQHQRSRRTNMPIPFKAYTTEDLSTFTGRPEASFPEDYSTQALADALLLFQMATCLTAIPDDPAYAEGLVDRAILSVADKLILNQPHAKELASPFRSETLLGYSYSKDSLTQVIASRDNTGIMWFDQAVELLGVCADFDGVPTGGGIEVFERDGQFVQGTGGDENILLLGPKEQNFYPYPYDGYSTRD